MSGKTVWKNPLRYLPGRMAPLIHFDVWMSLAYLALMGGFFSTWGPFWYNVNSKLDNASHCSWFIRNDSVVLRIFEFQPCRSPAGITTRVFTVSAVRKVSRQASYVVYFNGVWGCEADFGEVGDPSFLWTDLFSFLVVNRLFSWL